MEKVRKQIKDSVNKIKDKETLEFIYKIIRNLMD